jgi:hypothetical protein
MGYYLKINHKLHNVTQYWGGASWVRESALYSVASFFICSACIPYHIVDFKFGKNVHAFVYDHVCLINFI